MINLIPNPLNHIESFLICMFLWITFAYFLFLRIKAKKNIEIANTFIDVIESSKLIDTMSKVVRQSRNKPNKSMEAIETRLYEQVESIIENRPKPDQLTAALKEKIRPIGYTAVADHLRNIFMSGLFESRLEVEALIRHTELKLFNEAIRLKSILSSFIVLGLLGTLFGMSNSLSKFNETSVNNVNDLVSRDLPAAFIPSIWGIICTILGMIVYSRLVHIHFTPIKTKLENVTLNIWIPKLCPAFTESLVDKLEDNAKRIEEQFANAAKVAEFARDINDETGLFKVNLSKAGETLSRIEPIISENEASIKQLKQFADKLAKFSDKFTVGLDSFKSFEERLATSYGDLTSANESFAKLLSLWSTKFEDILTFHNDQSVDINKKIERIFSAIMDFEEQYLDANTVQSEAVTALVNTLKLEKESDAVQNREIAEKILVESTDKFNLIIESLRHLSSVLSSNMEAIDKDLGAVDSSLKTCLSDVSSEIVKSLINVQTELNGGLKGVQVDLVNGLNLLPAKLEEHNDKILAQFGRYDAPVKGASDKISLSYEGMVTAIQDLIRQFKVEISSNQTTLFTSLNQKIAEILIVVESNGKLDNDRIVEQTDISKKIVSSIDGLNTTLADYQLTKKSRFFS